MEVSFEVALPIVRKKLHAIGETIVKSCAVKMLKLILNESN